MSFNLQGQKNNTKKIDLNKGNIAEKFDQLYQKSSNYKQYKVVEHQLIKKLKKQVLDSLQKEKSIIAENRKKIAALEAQTKKLEKELQTAQNKVSALSDEKDSIGFWGSQIEKGKYKLIIGFIILALLLGLFYFIYAFKNSHQITKAAKENLEKLEEEYQNFRANALEREQLLKRQLLDEQKKSQA